MREFGVHKNLIKNWGVDSFFFCVIFKNGNDDVLSCVKRRDRIENISLSLYPLLFRTEVVIPF